MAWPGFFFYKPQNDLARKSAIPDVTLSEMQRWAEEQKSLILERVQIDENDSALLAQFGVEHTNLTFGKLGGSSLSYKEFVATIQQLISIKVHDGNVEHDDDDDVLRRDFNNFFEADELLLELPSQPNPDWLVQIDDGTLDRTSWSLDAALQSVLTHAWGEVNWEDDTQDVVGSVNGITVTRYCKIASRKLNLSDLE